jgi:hypothetical protein
LASSRSQRFCCCYRSSCSPALVHHGCRHGHCLRSLLLPYPLCPHPRSGFSVLSSANWSGIDPSGRRRGLLIDDGF